MKGFCVDCGKESNCLVGSLKAPHCKFCFEKKFKNLYEYLVYLKNEVDGDGSG